MPSPITRQDIQHCTSERAFERGQRYWEQGRVRELRLEGGQPEVAVSARTLGNQEYEQRIVIGNDEYGVEIDGRCSCPVAYNCKHVVAACLAMMHAGDELFEPTGTGDDALIEGWLDGLVRAGARPGSTDAQTSEELLVWVLAPLEDVFEAHPGRDLHHHQVQPRLVRRHATGGLSRGRTIRIANLADDWQRPSCALPDDIEIAQLLAATAHPAGDATPLAGRSGAWILDTLLDEGRLYWQSSEQAPLRRAGVRTLQLEWSRQSDGALYLSTAVSDAQLVAVEPPLYVDPEHGVMGRIDSRGLNGAQLRQLRASPSIPPARAARLAAALSRTEGLAVIPVPPAVSVRANTGNTPRACLRLGRGPRADSRCMYLEFAYADERVPALPRESVTTVPTDAGDIVEVERSLGDEQRALDRLLEIDGLETLPAMFGIGHNALAFVDSPELEASRWAAFLALTVPELEADGWRIDASGFDLDFETASLHAVVEPEPSGLDWFGLGFNLEIGTRTVPLVPLLVPLLRVDPDTLPPMVAVELPDGGFAQLPVERVRPLLAVLTELFDRVPGQSSDTTLRLSRFDSALLEPLADTDAMVRGRAAAEVMELGHRLADFEGIEPVPVPDALHATLRPYQQVGLDWLQFLRSWRLGGVLADDMGLGKTLQTLAHLQVEKDAGRLTRPALIVAPTSVVSNWKSEAARFTPQLDVLVLRGPDRAARFADLPRVHIAITTYPLLPRDADALRAQHWHSVILDEAQVVKNPRSKAARVARALQADHRLCLTGTPMENHLGELWAQFDFLMPGFLGDATTFAERYRKPIERHASSERQQALARRIGPFMLRRTKAEVVTELPPKTEIIQRAEFEPAQAELYESIRISMDRQVRAAIAERGLARSHLTILDALLRLRQVCCHPRLLNVDRGSLKAGSAKLELLMELLPPLLEGGHRVLLFSQFTSMLELIREQLDRQDIRYALLTGATRDRDAAISQFRGGAADLFLISLKAGGVGLNLPEADTVIHYDPWWNPAVENQATDRAHRIGQENPVFVYKLIVANTVEERIIELQARKQQLADATYGDAATTHTADIDAATLRDLFS